MSIVINALVAACKDKSCAPPPVGTGGSSPSSGVDAKQQWDDSFRARKFATDAEDPTTLVGYAANAVNAYIGNGFRGVNGYLRTGWTGNYEDEVKRSVQMIDKAFDLFGVSLEQPVTVYRGAQFDAGNMSMDELSEMFKKDAVVEDKAYVSTTLEPTKADQFSARGFLAQKNLGPLALEKVGVAFRIRLPEGTRVLAGHMNEQEFILRRGSKFRVVKTRRQTKRFLVVDMELMP